jgi:CRP-like cAMP-binding protein
MIKNALRAAMSQVILLKDDEWEAFEPFIVLKSYKKRENYVSEGQICHEVGFILRGAFRQYCIIEGEEKTTFFYFENQFVTNYESFVSQSPSNVTIEAMEDVQILTFNKETLDRLYRLYPAFETFGRLIAEQVYICAMHRLNTFLLNTPEQRYLHFLKSDDSKLILERVPQHYIASYLGITPVSLSRIRNRITRSVDSKMNDIR